MNTPIIYTATPADLSPPVQTDSFCVDLVLATDYQKLKDEFKQLAAENVALSKDAQRYRFIRERDMFGSDNESGLLSWEELTELECSEFDDALDARINHPNTGFIELDAKLQARKTPATDRIVAGIKADGVALVKSAFEEHIQSPSCYQDEVVGMESALSIASQVESRLLEGADK